MPPALFIHALEISVAQKPQTAREGVLRAGTIRFSGHTGGHMNSEFCGMTQRCAGEDARATLDYSRKPGFTETRLRPLARRRERTFWPPWVFMRERNPCFFDRLRRFGWKVRLGMKSSCS